MTLIIVPVSTCKVDPEHRRFTGSHTEEFGKPFIRQFSLFFSVKLEPNASSRTAENGEKQQKHGINRGDFTGVHLIPKLFWKRGGRRSYKHFTVQPDLQRGGWPACILYNKQPAEGGGQVGRWAGLPPVRGEGVSQRACRQLLIF